MATARSGVSSTAAAVDMRAKSNAAFVERHAIGQAENLKAAAVGEDRPVPAHERVQPAQRRDGLLARPQRQMIRVGQDHLRAGFAQPARVDALDRALRADRHEGGRFDRRHAAW